MGCCFNSLGQIKRSEIKAKRLLSTNVLIQFNLRRKGLFRVGEVSSSQEYSMGSGGFFKTLPKI